ncbi:MAG: AMP-binding protein [Cycloclasticus sp.]
MSTAIEKNLIDRVAMGDLFRRRASSAPHSIALVEYRDGDRLSLTHRKLNQSLNKVARALRSLGVQPGDRVALAGLNSIEFSLAIYGCMKGGYVVVPLNHLQSTNDLSYTINHCEAKAVIVEDSLIEKFQQIKTTLSSVDHWISMEVTNCSIPSGFLDFQDIIDEASDEEVTDVKINDRDPLQILYTSGTTSKPKGVETSHLALFINTLAAAIELGVRPKMTGSSVMPMFHCAQHLVTTTVMHVGGTAIIFRAFDPKAFLEAIETEKIQFVFLLPLMWKALLDVPEIDDYDLSSVSVGMYGMAPMDQPSLERLKKRFNCPFVLASGQTEMTPLATVFHDVWPEKKGNYWGEGILTTDQAVMNDEGNLLPNGEVGEIVWRAPSVMNGYYKDPQATAEASKFDWHHSGDLGYFDEDRQLLFVDRKKDMIKTGGENVPSVKVERVIMAHSAVAATTVIGLPHPHWTEAVTAFVILRPDMDATEADIIQSCRAELGGYELPKRVIFLTTLATTATGKFLKAPLREQYTDLYSNEPA